jgi:hypothetical protein
MPDFIVASAVFATGYVASIYTWPSIKVWVNGAESEAAKLEARADALVPKAKSIAGK